MWSFFSRDPVKGFPFEIGEKVEGLTSDQSIWSLHEGKQKSNSQPVSVFVFDISANSEICKQTAQASAKRLKTLRHPNVLTFIDSLESDKFIYVVTEHVVPLSMHLDTSGNDAKTTELEVSWGLHQIVKGLSFLLNNVNLIHNNVCRSSMFVDSSGEWKLGGIDYMYPATGEGSNYPPVKSLPDLEKYDPPEKVSTRGKSKKVPTSAADMWGLGCLIWESFNGVLPRSSSLKVIGKIPKNLVRNYCELVSANPAGRPNHDKFLTNCKSPNGFMSNHFVQTNLFLEEIQIKEPSEQGVFFSELTKHLDEFPPAYSKNKILPQLLKVFQFGSGGPAVLPPLFKLGKLLNSTEYQEQIVPCVVKLFSSVDRATRIHLLRQIPLFVEHLQPQVVNAQVFPNMLSGFMDTNPAIREQSVKGMLLLAPKLNDNNLNNELMKHFARLQSKDDQGPIRTNTTVCLGKITTFLNPATRHKVITSAFARAMKDPFPAARIAGVLAMCNNVQYFTLADSAHRALPVLCSVTVDPDKQVREHAFKTISVFLEKLQKGSESPEAAAKIDEQTMTSPSVQNQSGWAGWMTTGVSSITSKLYKTNVSGEAATNNTQQMTPTPAQNVGEKAEPEMNKQELEKLPESEEGVGNNEGWDDEDNDFNWDNIEPENNEEVENNEVDNWDDTTWEDTEIVEDKNEDKADWGGGWDNNSWAGENKITSAKPAKELTLASSYNWSQEEKKSDDFFGEFAPKPKTSKPRVVGERKNVKPVERKTVARKESFEKKESSMDDWGDSNWGDDFGADDGLSKAERMKLEREEKRKLRQQQIQEKRAKKSGTKFGTRKSD